MENNRILNLSIDIETFSSIDLAKCGVYKYCESPDFDILLFGYSINGGEVQTIDLASGEELPEEILDALTDETITKWAFHAQFERICLSAWLRKYYPEKFVGYSIPEDTVGNYLNPRSWKCSQVWSAYMGLPLSLKGVGSVLGLKEQKLSEGKTLIGYFSIPCKPTKANGGRTRNLPADAPEKWAAFKEYNMRDVEVEMEIQEKLHAFPVPDSVWEEYWLDQEINDRGIAIDMNLVTSAIRMGEQSRATLMEVLKQMTGLDNPNSDMQMKQWLEGSGLEVKSLNKKDVPQLIKAASPKAAEVLLLRQQLKKSSIKKYTTAKDTVCEDERVRGMFQFYGANRTGRWAGRLIQLQNLPRNRLIDLEQARSLVCSENYDALEMLYDDIPDTLSQLIRTVFVPRKGSKFIVADFSSIEARVLAWLAGEDWRTKVFERGEDIYCASASHMFGVPVEKNGVNGDLRQKGKISELALGYGGSVGALISMGALELGLPEEELPSLVSRWRNSNPNITTLWRDVDNAAMDAVKFHSITETAGIRFAYQSGMLFIVLPSGRQLAYVKPRIDINKFGRDGISYEGIGEKKNWERLDTYGPKLVENIVQGISRDILAYAMRTLSHCFIVMHVHDELVIEADPRVSVEELAAQMGRTPPWAKGLKLRADGFETNIYKKD